jgi:hypothetical protein
MTTGASERPKRVLVGGLINESQRRFLDENARRNDRSLSAELRRALSLYEAAEQKENNDHE